MKKIIIIFVLTIISLFSTMIIVKGYVATGHDDFKEIIFEDKDVCLLVNRTQSEFDEIYKKMGRKAFGWVTYYFNVNSKAIYVGDTIFSRSNRTSEDMTISYRLREEDYNSTSLKINGNVDAKITAQSDKKTISGSLSPSFGITSNKNKTFTKEEISEFKINIHPHTMISLRIVGDCYVTSALSKYYFLGIQLKKGQWERVDVETTYYELYEEKLG